MYEAFKKKKKIRDYFRSVLLLEHAIERNGVNVVSGLVFDYNYYMMVILMIQRKSQNM